jgi:hypothetical protein
MKPNLILTAFLIICCVTARSQSANSPFNFSSQTESDKKAWLKKNNVVQISPNPSYNGTVKVSSKTAQVLHFYIFDLEGTLVYQAVFKTRETKAISNLGKGTYMYNVFANDESIEEGKLIVK